MHYIKIARSDNRLLFARSGKRRQVIKWSYVVEGGLNYLNT